MGSSYEHAATSDVSDLTGVQPERERDEMSRGRWGLADDPGAYLLAVAPLLVAMAIAFHAVWIDSAFSWAGPPSCFFTLHAISGN